MCYYFLLGPTREREREEKKKKKKRERAFAPIPSLET